MKKVILATLVFAPALAFAAAGDLTALQNIVDSIGRIITAAIPIVFGLALLAFLWGLVKYIFAQGDETAKADGKKIMLWGLVALFVGASVWGIVTILRTTLGIGKESSIIVPEVL